MSLGRLDPWLLGWGNDCGGGIHVCLEGGHFCLGGGIFSGRGIFCREVGFFVSKGGFLFHAGGNIFLKRGRCHSEYLLVGISINERNCQEWSLTLIEDFLTDSSLVKNVLSAGNSGKLGVPQGLLKCLYV